MSTKYGTNATARDVTVPASKIAYCDKGAPLRVLYDEYIFTADLAVNDLINMMKIPAGARVMDVVLDSPDLDSASAGALTVGWAGNGVDSVNLAGFLSSADVHTAGKTLAMSTLLQSSVAGKFKQFTVETQVQIKITGETDATTGTIRLAVYYSLD